MNTAIPEQWLPPPPPRIGERERLGATLVLSLLVTVPFCGWLLQALIRRQERK